MTKEEKEKWIRLGELPPVNMKGNRLAFIDWAPLNLHKINPDREEVEMKPLIVDWMPLNLHKLKKIR